MLYVGVTGWGDHDTLYKNGIAPRDKLKEYGAHFPTVEVDASFYAVQPLRNMQKWVEETPESFQFIVKAYQGMTGHERGDIPFETKEEMFQAFIDSLAPMREAGKLAMVLFQFPPWFDCQRKNVEYLRYCKRLMEDVPLAVEFRHQSWYLPDFLEKTLAFLQAEKWIHTVCDEPQAGEGCVPIVLRAADPGKTLVRLHGRNNQGWQKQGNKNWRDVRYLYRYNEDELHQWVEFTKNLQKQSEQVYMLFNNNSGGDAADNAKQFIELAGLTYDNLASRQLDLF
ncbi:DUF72 domain-containing protein [Bacillus badius]|uniref:DUF72 domain-containing protein n=1 Tax=Bacillus badius TaxID=1455 RepID=A0ABR5AXJ8_BACBA|nr:DUF72 domain-containing protein [Bacillus badius]KIL79466.1 hypothetical protein SD77_3332 [Bacillus badius]MED4716633.1 DUF72 domain-containing protein [Bacillus badius]